MNGINREFVAAEKPVWGVCAGLILLADRVVVSTGGTTSAPSSKKAEQQQQPLIGGLDVTVSRNHFGRQSASR